MQWGNGNSIFLKFGYCSLRRKKWPAQQRTKGRKKNLFMLHRKMEIFFSRVDGQKAYANGLFRLLFDFVAFHFAAGNSPRAERKRRMSRILERPKQMQLEIPKSQFSLFSIRKLTTNSSIGAFHCGSTETKRIESNV